MRRPGATSPSALDIEGVRGAHPTNSCALTEDGEVVCWGWEAPRAEGVRARRLADHPALLFEGPYASVVSAAGRGLCVVTPGGGAECWVEAWAGFGEAPTPFEDLPKATALAEIDPDARYTAVSASSEHVCAITTDGRAVCRTDAVSHYHSGALTLMTPPDPAPDRYIAIGVGWGTWLRAHAVGRSRLLGSRRQQDRTPGPTARALCRRQRRRVPHLRVDRHGRGSMLGMEQLRTGGRAAGPLHGDRRGLPRDLRAHRVGRGRLLGERPAI